MAKGFDSKQPKKVSKRQKAYFKLIAELLECRSGQEVKVLRAKQHLIDAGLLQTMVQVARFLKEDGERERADFLMNIAANLAGEQGSGSVRPINQLTKNNFDGDDEGSCRFSF